MTSSSCCRSIGPRAVLDFTFVFSKPRRSHFKLRLFIQRDYFPHAISAELHSFSFATSLIHSFTMTRSSSIFLTFFLLVNTMAISVYSNHPESNQIYHNLRSILERYQLINSPRVFMDLVCTVMKSLTIFNIYSLIISRIVMTTTRLEGVL